MKQKYTSTIYFIILITVNFILLGGLAIKIEAYGYNNSDNIRLGINSLYVKNDLSISNDRGIDERNIGAGENDKQGGQIVGERNNENGIASWYDYDLNGIEWSKNHRTCASRDLPRYSTAIVTNLDNGKKVECFVNDYGPEAWTGRDIDLSSYAFSQIANLSLGLANVKIEPKL